MKKYWKMLVGLLLLCNIWNVYQIEKTFWGATGECCIADGLRILANVKIIGIPFILLTICYVVITKEDFQPMKILRLSSRKMLWKKQMKQIVQLSCICCISMLVPIVVFLYINDRQMPWINWTFHYSQYAILQKGIISEISFVGVFIKAFFLMYCRIVIVFVISQLLIWVVDVRSLPVILITVMVFSDMYSRYSYCLFKMTSYSLLQWGGLEHTVVKISGMLFCILGLMFLGYWYCERKEFIGSNVI